jgi:2-dehydro-3-deoxyphosphooctonate aldolase (KDO 8-P synthase)
LFLETHPNPNEAKSDGPNSWPLRNLKALLMRLKAIDSAVKSGSLEEHLD